MIIPNRAQKQTEVNEQLNLKFHVAENLFWHTISRFCVVPLKTNERLNFSSVV